ncbi:hypothetical protein [Petroclostridium sp. X23]|uniref:hypothetical protein n=1 Tax=Petroclostridium sp. X23 TaxID=3045146 RepID=UPI0024ADBFD1|nr:hypothetical protein [Petroclostridium sp. X23]WHH58107.1 hypothetical protein QKW49_20230 [Petroclostridium sp. X23]
MEVLAQTVLWSLFLFYFISHLLVIRKANRMPDPPDYPPKEWDPLQQWIESPKCIQFIAAYLIIGTLFAWFAVK